MAVTGTTGVAVRRADQRDSRAHVETVSQPPPAAVLHGPLGVRGPLVDGDPDLLPAQVRVVGRQGQTEVDATDEQLPDVGCLRVRSRHAAHLEHVRPPRRGADRGGDECRRELGGHPPHRLSTGAQPLPHVCEERVPAADVGGIARPRRVIVRSEVERGRALLRPWERPGDDRVEARRDERGAVDRGAHRGGGVLRHRAVGQPSRRRRRALHGTQRRPQLTLARVDEGEVVELARDRRGRGIGHRDRGERDDTEEGGAHDDHDHHAHADPDRLVPTV